MCVKGFMLFWKRPCRLREAVECACTKVDPSGAGGAGVWVPAPPGELLPLEWRSGDPARELAREPAREPIRLATRLAARDARELCVGEGPSTGLCGECVGCDERRSSAGGASEVRESRSSELTYSRL